MWKNWFASTRNTRRGCEDFCPPCRRWRSWPERRDRATGSPPVPPAARGNRGPWASSASCARLAGVGWGWRKYVLRYGVALANSRAELSLLLAPHRPEESQRAVSAAADTWYDLLQVEQRASLHRSGVHGMQRDLEWFQATFPQEDVARRGPERQTEHMSCPVFELHGLAVQELEAGYLEDAIGDFSASLEKRSEGHTFDWLYLAWAHWKLDQKDKAREWFDKADQWIQQQPTRDVELDELRSQVAQIMSE